MATSAPDDELLSTVDVRELNTLRWGPMRAMFPRFAEDVELARYLKKFLRTSQCTAVRIELHRQPDGELSSHIYDVYRVRPG